MRSEVSSASPSQVPQINSSSYRSGICSGSLSPATPAVTIKSSDAKSKCTWTEGGSLRHPRAPAGGAPALSGSGVAGSAIMNLQLEPLWSELQRMLKERAKTQTTLNISYQKMSRVQSFMFLLLSTMFKNLKPIILNVRSIQKL